MDPIITSIGGWLLGKVSDKAFEKTTSSLTADKIDNSINQAIKKTSKTLQRKYPDILGSSIESFFRKEEVLSELVKLTFKDAKVNLEIIEERFDTKTLPYGFILEFIIDLRKEMLNDRHLNTLLADSEIYIAVTGLKKDTESIAQDSSITRENIDIIKNILEEKFAGNFTFTEFIETYSRNALNNLSEVNFIGLGVKSHIIKNRKRLQEIFVEPNFTPSNEESRQRVSNNLIQNTDLSYFSRFYNPHILEYKKIFSNSKNFVVLGNPGAGKSLMCKSIICSILLKSLNDFDDKNIFDCIPFRIELRKYAQFKKNSSYGIVKYIVSLLESEYGIPNVPFLKIEHLFKEYNTLLLFDGLDEIFDINEKISIKNDIEIFCINFDKTRNLVTSRIIGYEEVKLKSNLFYDINIANFNETQIAKYVNKWYANEEVDEELRKHDVEGFLSHIHEIDNELITNPLLLSLIVILYRNNLKIPESKLEIYQSCTKTLVDKWDGSKELSIDLDEEVSKRKESIFADLAFWHYEQAGKENVNITNSRVQGIITETIVTKLQITNDFVKGAELAESFLDYAQKRSLYFDNNFTHKTFLEYFTAFWIYSNIEKKHKVQKRNALISKYISSAFWHVVLELLLNMIDDNQADNEILDSLLSKQINSETSYPFILLVIPTLKNVSPNTIDSIYLSSLKLEIKKYNICKKSKNDKVKFDIYEYYENNLRVENIYKNFMKAYNKLFDEMKDEENIRIYFTLYGELTISGVVFLSEHYNYLGEEFINRDLYLEYIEKDPYLFILNLYTFADLDPEAANTRLISGMLKGLRLFGAEAFLSEYSGFFRNNYIGYIRLFSHVFMRNIEKLDLEIFLIQFEEAGLSRMQLYNYLKNNLVMEHANPEYDLVDLIGSISEQNSDLTNAVIAGYICQSFDALGQYSDSYRSKMQLAVDASNAHSLLWVNDLLTFDSKDLTFKHIDQLIKVE